MSFNQIVWKMAKAHYKKYIFYLLCNCFSVMLFFMFSTVYFNERVVEVKKSESIQYVLTVPSAALVFFTIFFISYAHNIFIKKRKSELGLLMSLGMSNRDICKLLLIENATIAIFSIISGILAGAVFSRLFFLILMNSVGLQTVPFHINSKMVLYSVLAFFSVFFVAVGRSLFLILAGNVVQSLNSDKTAETIKKKDPMLGAIGVMIVIGSIVGLYYTYADSSVGGELLLLWAMATFIGLFISLYQFTSFFIQLAKKNTAYYYSRLLFLTNLEYKFKQLTSILMLVTSMIMVTILYSTIILFTYISNEKEAIQRNPYDISFLQTDQKNNLEKETLNSIVNSKNNRIQKHLIIPIYEYYQKLPNDHFPYVFTFMAVDDFNKLSSKKITLEDKEYVHFINTDEELAKASNGNAVQPIPINQVDIHYKLKETIVAKYINNLSNLDEIVVVNKSQLSRIKKQLHGFEANIHLINVTNWKNSIDVVDKLDQELKNYNKTTPAFADVRVENITEEEYFRIESKVADYNRNKHSQGILFFVTTFLSIIFFIGSFVLLYLNFFSDIEKEKAKYKKLNNIGITAKEVKRIISKELTIVFFIPTIVGTTLALLYIIAMAKDIGGVMKNPEILLYFFIVAGIYECIQIIFFFFARRKVVRLLVEK